MALLPVLLQVARVAIGTAIHNDKASLIPSVITEVKGKIKRKRKMTKTELKIHELSTLLTQLILTVFQLIKLIRAFFPNYLWKSPHQ